MGIFSASSALAKAASAHPSISELAATLELKFELLKPLYDKVYEVEPTVEIQLLCLLVTAVKVALFIKITSKILSYLFRQSRSITSNRIRDCNAIMENLDEYCILLNLAFDVYVMSNYPKLYLSGKTPTYAQWLRDGGVPDASKTSFQTYLSDTPRRRLFYEFVTADMASELTVNLQHSVAGACGVLALMADDGVSFLWYARCGIAWALAISAGFVGPVGLLNFCKNQLDLKSDSDINKYMTLQLIQGFFYVSTRGFGWLFLAYQMLTKLYHSPAFEWPFFAGCVLVISAMTAVNLLICEFCRLGLIKALERTKIFVYISHTEVRTDTVCVVTEEFLAQIQEEADAEEKEDAHEAATPKGRGPTPTPGALTGRSGAVERVKRRKSSLFAPLMAKANSKRRESKKSANLMGFDMKDVAEDSKEE
ncbi:hypothetical protein TeGR_g4935 [Tetraparma gracilis]|uniref:Transmembrane protein n=1 Tax=Tetraparma gracilis TaxID=2962635 RepID=A0ABQ6MIB2_9STRA|nr:hypothetical protein TeGR_g4935 [Tetraparma gracilis]